MVLSEFSGAEKLLTLIDVTAIVMYAETEDPEVNCALVLTVIAMGRTHNV